MNVKMMDDGMKLGRKVRDVLLLFLTAFGLGRRWISYPSMKLIPFTIIPHYHIGQVPMIRLHLVFFSLDSTALFAELKCIAFKAIAIRAIP